MRAHRAGGGAQGAPAVGGVDLAGQGELERRGAGAFERVDEALRAGPSGSPPRPARPAGPRGRPASSAPSAATGTDDDDRGRPQVDLRQPLERRAHHALGRRGAAGDDGDGRVRRALRRGRARRRWRPGSVMPMRITRVPPARASASQSGPSEPGGSPTRPVTTVTEDARPRWVTGIPTAAGTPKADVTPGTTSQGMPACASTSTSSPPRPKRNGSPPFSRTTTAERRPCSTSSRAISSWRAVPPAARVGILADVDQFGRGRDQVQDGRADQAVVEDDIGPGQEPGAPPGQEPGVAGSRAHEVDGHRAGSRVASPRRRQSKPSIAAPPPSSSARASVVAQALGVVALARHPDHRAPVAARHQARHPQAQQPRRRRHHLGVRAPTGTLQLPPSAARTARSARSASVTAARRRPRRAAVVWRRRRPGIAPRARPDPPGGACRAGRARRRGGCATPAGPWRRPPRRRPRRSPPPPGRPAAPCSRAPR